MIGPFQCNYWLNKPDGRICGLIGCSNLIVAEKKFVAAKKIAKPNMSEVCFNLIVAEQNFIAAKEMCKAIYVWSLFGVGVRKYEESRQCHLVYWFRCKVNGTLREIKFMKLETYCVIHFPKIFVPSSKLKKFASTWGNTEPELSGEKWWKWFFYNKYLVQECILELQLVTIDYFL